MSTPSRSSAHPRVSVIIPAFNRPQFLREAVESVFAQTFVDWELIIADDGSGVQTSEYLRGLSELSPVKVIWLSHLGIPARARNAGLKESCGEYVAFLDSDDTWEARKLQAQLAVLEGRGECQWSYSAFTNVDSSGKRLVSESRRVWTPCEGEVFEKILRGEVAIRTPTVLAARSLIVAAGMFDESIRSAEDCDLWLRLALHSPLAVCNEPLVNVRFHGEHHSADWASAYVGQDHTFRKLLPSVNAERRSLLRRERVRNALRLANGYAVLRQRAAALAVLARSAVFSWHHAYWWLRSARVILRAFVPERMLVFYRRYRGSPV
jgi:glycosyltransferase involved in cell wall biosynthesis